MVPVDHQLVTSLIIVVHRSRRQQTRTKTYSTVLSVSSICASIGSTPADDLMLSRCSIHIGSEYFIVCMYLLQKAVVRLRAVMVRDTPPDCTLIIGGKLQETYFVCPCAYVCLSVTLCICLSHLLLCLSQ